MRLFSWGFSTFDGDNCSVKIVVQLLTAEVFDIILNGVLAEVGLCTQLKYVKLCALLDNWVMSSLLSSLKHCFSIILSTCC